MNAHKASKRRNFHVANEGVAAVSWWKKPIVWLAGIVVAALGVAITNELVPRFGQGLDRITQSGDSVVVNNIRVHQNGGIYAALPADAHISDDEATEVESNDKQLPWFEAKGGSLVGFENIQLTVSGNRQEGVRIMDIVPVKQCQAPLNGAYFEAPSAGGAQSLFLYLDLDAPHPQAMDRPAKNYDGSVNQAAPYFSANTVSLAKDEQFVFVLAVKVDKSYCTFSLDLSILEDDAVHTQRIDNHGKPFSLTPKLPRSEWQHAYFGGVACSRNYGSHYRPAPREWFKGIDTNLC